MVFVLCNEQTQVPLQRQQLLYNGKEMRNTERLSALGLSEGDLVMMVSNSSPSSRYYNLQLHLILFSVLSAKCCTI